MARKVVVPDDDRKNVGTKRKRSKCCTCCLGILLMGFVVLAVAFCVGWFMGDKYLKQYYGVTMKETWGVVTGLYWKNDKDVVTNPYTDDDLNGFYSEIKTNILLRADAEVDFDAALSDAIDKYIASSSDSGAANAKSVGAFNSSENGDESDSANGEIMDIFIDMIAGVFTRDNIDIERLEDYSEENDNYIFTLRDKQLAAFVSSVLDVVLANTNNIDMLSGFSDMIKFKDVLKLKQISFGATSSANVLGEKTISASTADVTVWIGLQDAAGQALRYMLDKAGYGWAGGVAAWLGNVILPKNLYATVTIPLYGDAAAQITLNDMSEEKREVTYKLLNHLLASFDGSEAQTIQDILGSFAEKIKPILETAADKINFDDSINGSIGIDLIGAMADMVSKNLDSSDPLTKADFMYVLQALLTTDVQTRKLQLKPYLYEGWYSSVADPSAEYVYDPTDKNGYVAVDYKDVLRDELANKFCLDVTDPDTGEKVPLDELFEIFGISFGNSASTVEPKKMLEWMKPGGLKELLDPEIDINDLKLNVTDRMLGALLSDQMSSIISSGAGYEDLELILDALTFTSRPATRPGHMYATLAVEIDLTKMLDLGSDNVLGKLASNILPDRILLTVDIDITGSTIDTTLSAGDKRDDVTFMFNDYVNTDKVLDTLGKLMPELNIGELTVKIESTLIDMLDKLNSLLDISLTASDPTADVVRPGVIVMPDVFTVITDLILIEKEDGVAVVDPITGKNKTVVTAEQFKSVLAGLEDNDVEIGEPIATDYKHFLNELTDKYYLNTEDREIEKFSDLTEYIDGDINADKFNITGEDVDKKYLAYDVRANSSLRPIMTAAELGLIMTENMGENIEDFVVESVETFGSGGGESGMVAMLSIKISDLMPSEVKSLISVDNIYITARIVTSEVVGDGTEDDPKRHPISFELNNMTEDTCENTLKIVKCFMPDFDLDGRLKEFGAIVYDQLNSLTESLGGDEDNSFVSFTDEGVRLKSFYEFLATKLDMPDANPDVVKAAVQGMYYKSALPELANSNNYLVDDVVKYRTPDEDKGVFDRGEFTAVTEDGVPRIPIAGDKGKTYTDTQFNDYLDGIIKNMAYPEPDSGARAVQTVILKANDNSSDAMAMRAWLNDGRLENSPIKTGKDYMVITFEMQMDSYAETDKENASVQTLLPETVLATIVMEKVDSDDGAHSSFELVNGDGLVFNNMRYDAYGILFELMGMNADATDEGTVNISTVTKKSVEVINGLGELGRIDFEPTSGNGVGEMQFTYYGPKVSLSAVQASVAYRSFI